jgi:hypothetical protein
MSAYQLLMLFHVLAAFWVSVSAFGGTVLRAVIRRAPDLAARVAVMRAGARFGLVFGLIGGLAVGISGLSLVMLNPAWMRMVWVHTSIALWALMLSLNLFLLGPRLRKLLAAGEASLQAGAPTEELKRLSAHPIPAYLAELPAIAVVLFAILMVLKPF